MVKFSETKMFSGIHTAGVTEKRIHKVDVGVSLKSIFRVESSHMYMDVHVPPSKKSPGQHASRGAI